MMAASRSRLGAAARELAAAGHPVLPLHTPGSRGCSCGRRDCGSPGKHPRSTYGLHDASTNAEQVEAWWYGQPEANIGMRTDSLLVVDVDGPEGERSLVRLEGELGELPPTREQHTGRGRHLLYAVEEPIGNSTRPLGDPAGLDLRGGSRGYIVAAPSRHATGALYRWLDERAPAPLPQGWLERLRRPLRLVPALEPPALEQPAETTRYGAAALEQELCTILRARHGKRNETLNCSVFKLAQLVAEHRLARQELERSAFEVALLAGLTPFETRKTISSAIEAGLRNPRPR
jgi:Bifunctional DNA primase/polymerase, N-terminal